MMGYQHFPRVQYSFMIKLLILEKEIQMTQVESAVYTILFLLNCGLASCQWGPVTAHWVGILTEMYVIHMEWSS